MIRVVGIGADGWAGLPSSSQELVRSAGVVLGGPRHLDLLPHVPGQERVPWPSPLREGLSGLLASLPDGVSVVALASGDPLLAGVGSTLAKLLGAEAVEIVPAVSSVAWARARMRWPAETVEVIRDPRTIARHLASGRRVLVLSTDGSTPAYVAKTLTEHGFGESRLTVLANLGADDETSRTAIADDWVGDSPSLHVLAVECVGTAGAGLLAGLPDDAFEHDGQLTKRDLRASALARLAPQPGQLLWDVGAGAGSVGIEWMRAHPTCRAVAVEQAPERAACIGRNALTLGVPALRVVAGAAPAVLTDLPRPDAVFVGGGATVPGVLEACWSALSSGGRLVVHGVTMETEVVLARWYAEHGGELTRIGVAQAAPLGSMTGWTPSRAVTQWAVTR